jgi:hypothetical protein
MHESNWLEKIADLYFKKPGQHSIIGGPTGTGKTQTIYFNLDGIIHHSPRETISYFDVAKSGEILRLADLRPLKIFIPAGRSLDLKFKKGKEDYASRITFEYFKTDTDNPYEFVFENMEREKINVVCLKPFLREADKYATEISKYSETLMNMAIDLRLNHIKPSTHTFDEFHWVAPGQGHALNEEHNKAGVTMQMNIDTLRSMKHRILAATQSWTKIRRGVRTSFMFIWIKRGLMFTKTDEPRLARYNEKWESLGPNQTVVVFPRRNFSDYISLPFYGDGDDIGEIYYRQSPSFAAIPSVPNLEALSASIK